MLSASGILGNDSQTARREKGMANWPSQTTAVQ
jgi:hypothetical protein